jgi:Na+/melibiose symporter-like transporter
MALVYISIPSDLDIPEAKKSAEEVKVDHPIRQLLRVPMFISFLAFIFTAGFVRSVINVYLSYYVYRTLQFGKVMPAYLALIRLASEVVMFFFGHFITEGIGYHGVLVLSQLAGLVRILGYGWFPIRASNYPWGLMFAAISLLESLKGVNSGLIVIGATKFAAELAPQGCNHTAQGLLNGVYTGLSTAMGALCAGLFLRFVSNNKDDHIVV